MSGTEGLGRLFNVIQPADNVYVNLENADGVTFIGFEVDGATTFTITFASDADGTDAATPDVIDHYYGRSNDTADGVWHRTAQTASEVVTATDATEDQVAIYVSGEMGPAGLSYVKCDSDAGVVTAILHDLNIQRAPENLASVTA